MVKLGVMGNRGDLTNEQWERIEALLPKGKTKRGRPAQDHRKLLNGIVWVLRTGAPWRDMPEGKASGRRSIAPSSVGGSRAAGASWLPRLRRAWNWGATEVGRSTSMAP